MTFECRVLPAAFAPCSAPLSLGGFTDGSHTFEVRAIDQAGNVDPTPASITWLVDTAPPKTQIVTAPAAKTFDTSASFTFGANKSPVTYECALDAAVFAPCSSSESYDGLALGNHSLQVRARDLLGNVDPAPATWQWTIDPHTITFAGGGCSSSNGSTGGLLALFAAAALLLRRRQKN